MVLLRLITSSLLLLAFARPRLRSRSVTDWKTVLALGFALGAMNWAFYESFARIPLGAAVTIEFVGPLSLAAVGSRHPRDFVWVGLAALGVTLLGAGPTRVDPVGFGLALLAGGGWALYILSSAATGRRWSGLLPLLSGRFFSSWRRSGAAPVWRVRPAGVSSGSAMGALLSAIQRAVPTAHPPARSPPAKGGSTCRI
jgi:threonine/homoserine efflux transporter RhtA